MIWEMAKWKKPMKLYYSLREITKSSQLNVQVATSGMLKRNNIDLLSNVKYFWSTESDDFALRTDGTVWKVTGVPEKIITLGTGGMVYGDVKVTGTVTAADLLIVMNNLSGRTGLTDDQALAADVDGDGMVTLADLTKMIQYVSGRISSL